MIIHFNAKLASLVIICIVAGSTALLGMTCISLSQNAKVNNNIVSNVLTLFEEVKSSNE